MAKYRRKKLFSSRKVKDPETKKRERRFVSVFLVLLIIIASASAITFLRERAKNEREKYKDREITVMDSGDRKDAFNIMFAAVSSEKEVLYLCILGMDVHGMEYRVTCLNPPANADPSRPDDLLKKAESACGMELDRYVIITREQFKDFMQVLGGYKVELNNRIDYSDRDFSINLQAGKRTLYGDLFFNYLRFTGLGGTKHEREKQAEVIVDFIRQCLTEETVKNGEDIFSRLVNTCTTNISIIDFHRYQPVIEASVADRLNIVVYDLEKDGDK